MLSSKYNEKEKTKEYENSNQIKQNSLRGPSNSIFIRTQSIKHNTNNNFIVPYKTKAPNFNNENKIKFINSKNYLKLDYSYINSIKKEQYDLMNGLYSKQRPGIAYINPKVNEPIEMISGRPPRKVMIDRMKKVYSTININSLLKKKNIDYSVPNPLDEWLPLEFFDDKEHDIYTSEEWIQKAKSTETLSTLFIPGVGLKIESDGSGTWNRVLINNYNNEKEVYLGYWDTNDESILKKTEIEVDSLIPCELPKIHLLFDAENPYLFCQKVRQAHKDRIRAESIIRYNYYIDKMVQDNLPDISDDQKSRLKRKIEKNSFFKKMEANVDELVKELNTNYLRTTNKIIFDKFYRGKNSNLLIIKNLKLPSYIFTSIEEDTNSNLDNDFEELDEECNNNNLLNYRNSYKSDIVSMGLESIPKYNYISSYQKFTFETLLCRKEIIICLHKIKEECHKIRNNEEIFDLNIYAPVRLQKFKQMQTVALNKIEKLMCKEWLKTLKETLERSLKNVGKGSFNLKVKSKEIYEYLKLKKYMTVVKLIMQDTLYSLVTKSMVRYVNFFESFVPEEVNIISVNKVEHLYKEDKIKEELNTTNDIIANQSLYNKKTSEDKKTEVFLEEDDFFINPEEKWPLFKVNLIKREDKKVDITTKPEELMKELKFFFEEALKRMQKVPQVEPELLSNLIKKAEGQIIPLKSIIKAGKQKPEPTPQSKIVEGFELNDDIIWIWDMYLKLEDNLKKALEPIKPYLEQFNIFEEDLKLDPVSIRKNIKADDKTWTPQKIKEDIIKNNEREAFILNTIPEIINVSFFQINCKEFRIDLANKYAKLSELEIEILKEKAEEVSKDILNKYVSMNLKIKKEIVTIDDLIEVKEFIENINIELESVEENSKKANEIFDILEHFKADIGYKLFEFKSKIFGGPIDVKNTITSIHFTLEKKKDNLYEEQKILQSNLKKDIDIALLNIKGFDIYKTDENYSEPYNFVVEVNNNLEIIMSSAKLYQDRENLFGKEQTNYDMLDDMKRDLDPYYNMWVGIYTFNTKIKEWLDKDFSLLNGEEMSEIHDDITAKLKLAYLAMNDDSNFDKEIIELCSLYRKKVSEFRPVVELAIALTQKGYDKRHWVEIYNKTGIDCTPRENFSFNDILKKGMLDNLNFCQDIGEKASKEYQIGATLDVIEKKWKEILFVTVPHKTTSIPNISNWNDIYKDLDNDISDVQALEISSFKDPYINKIADWSRDLLNISNVLEEWNKLQRYWIYLQPVFDSSDIARDIPNEFKKFSNTDRMWKDLMLNVEKAPKVKDRCCSNDGLLDKLKEANINLYNVEKGLHDYMDKKRNFFPRFYFLSNNQFLEILSQTKDTKKIKDNLGKIFESIDNIKLKENRYIISFFSRFGESLEVEDIEILGKSVEEWMKELEKKMFIAVRFYIEQCLQHYESVDRAEWVSVEPSHKGQAIMTVNQIGWTKEMIKHISNQTLKDYLEIYKKKLIDIVEIVRTNESRIKGITFANLITIDVHNQSIISDLIKNNITDVDSFEWIMQLRYYWETNFANKYDVKVKSVQSDFPYGYEYIGNAEILVITPLTDRCYLTLMGALELNLGGAPNGPAGTGKTETTKDLARNLAKQCIVYNCSDETDYKMLGRFFKGLACCGAWICFDEFNRINLEVLSVIAQQLLKLFGAKNLKQENIVFEETNITIISTFCVFITMNPPGYGGRSELPDNLKALFRPIAMMVPNYRLISEISLYSSGYKYATALATKVVYTMKLSSEQLSDQKHYDYGMRAVKSVLNAARRLKRTDANTEEDQLLLRALEDVNVPKFLKEDIPLFKYIIKDLFPTTERPNLINEELMKKCEESCKERLLFPTAYFKQKITELYDTLQVRHGLMIVGPAGGGKTSNYNVLKDAFCKMSEIDDKFFYTRAEIINPKAIKNTEIYSELDPNTGEWALGVLPTWINQFKADLSGKNKYWIVFDGPVDAMWIEDMNSVLDDSKKLCLASSDIIVLNEMITIMFEVENLNVASPATVSRCGMVYMEPTSLGLEPIYKCWLYKMPKNIIDYKIRPTLEILFGKYLMPVIQLVRKQLVEPCPTANNSLLNSLMKILDCFFEKFKPLEAKNRKTFNEEVNNLEENIEAIFIYAIIWSFGVTTNEQGRITFSNKLRDLINQNIINKNLMIPEDGLVYDYNFNVEKKTWIHWLDTIPQFEIGNSISYTDIIVPTADSIRHKYLVNMLLKCNKNVICTGPTGTGKTIGVNEILRDVGDKFVSINLTFSAQTSARQTQDSIDSKIKKRGRNLYGPENYKIGAIFIDDLNMPVRQISGAQPPIEFIRQWLDHSMWYNLTTKSPITVVDLVVLGAMGSPEGARSILSQRFQRHFNLIGFTELEDSSIQLIFNTKLSYFFNKLNMNDEIKNNINNIVKGVIDVYRDVKLNMLATPAKLHYIFNLRDISKVIQGISSVTKNISTKNEVVRVWTHELIRVFGDRFINNTDKSWLTNKLTEYHEKLFKVNKDEIYNTGNKLIYCNFNKGDKNYSQTTNFNELKNTIYYKLQSYNDTIGKKKPLNLVMFLDACDHVCRICRILLQPGGNALLFGVGGSGRQSLARLSTYINEYGCHSIEVVKGYSMADFNKTVKDCLMKCANSSVPTPQTFILVDTQLIFNEMLEVVNNILNTGEVSGIYKADDMETIRKNCQEECKTKYKIATEANIMKVYTNRIIKNIHIVLAMSPIGHTFAQRLRNFPSLVNCSTIDWFSEWPEEALQSVAFDKLKNYELDLLGLEDKVVDSFRYIHKLVESESELFSLKLRRHYYLTPTSYLELITLYHKILLIKREEVNRGITRLKTGLQVLQKTEEEVSKMEINIKIKAPQLEEARDNTNKLIKSVNEEKQKADVTANEASSKKKIADNIKNECDIMLAEANSELAACKPMIEKAIKSVKKVKKDDLEEIKRHNTLIDKVAFVIECLLIFLVGHNYRKRANEVKTDVKIEGKSKYDIKKAFTEVGLDVGKFLLNLSELEQEEKLDTFRKEKYNNMMLLSSFISDCPWDINELRRGTEKIVGLFEFFNLMIEYVDNATNKIDPIMKDVEKRKIEKEEAEKNVQEADELKRLIDEKVAGLEATLKEENTKLEELDKNLSKEKNKLKNAQKLIKLLSSEKTRWSKTIENLQSSYNNLIGDCIIAASSIAYNGPFTYEYRENLESKLRNYINKLGIYHNPKTSMKLLLEDQIKSREWSVNGLPQDQLSIENALIMQYTRRWPLLIDPQNQGSNFIKKMGKKIKDANNVTLFEIVKANDPNLLNQIVLCLKTGKLILIEGMGTYIDPSLDIFLNQGNIPEIKYLDNKYSTKNFKLYITTAMPNPHYAPETFVKVTIINFGITPKGLEEQMMTLLINNEMPELEQKKNSILIENFNSQRDLKKKEDDILQKLEENSDNIDSFIEGEGLIKNLEDSITQSEDINRKMKESESTAKEIELKREHYRDAAIKGSLLFFATIDLSNIDHMYQFSLQWYSKLYESSIKSTQPNPVVEVRVKKLNENFLKMLYENVCRSIFEKDKLLYSMLLTYKLMTEEKYGEEKIKKKHWKFLLGGTSGDIELKPNPCNWISVNEWTPLYRQIRYISDNFEEIKGFENFFINNCDKFKYIYNSSIAHKEPLPDEWDNKFQGVLKLCFIKAFRPDKLILAIQDWISQFLGPYFIEAPGYYLSKSYKESSNIIPITFILKPGSDPINDLLEFSNIMGFSRNFEQISLGRGQEKIAISAIEAFRSRGGWLLLQNCHLAPSFMGKLEDIVDNFDTNWPDKDFRLWLTSASTEIFPSSILQASVKITMEPPKGLKNNLKRTYNKLDNKDLEGCSKQDEFKCLLFGLSFFHAIVQDRSKYGPIGWNTKYDFTNEDWMVSKKQLVIFLDQYKDIPYKVLDYLIGDINYGGRVTDSYDQRLIKTILATYLNESILQTKDYLFSNSDTYFCPEVGDLDQYLNYIESLPNETSPEVFGLHDNAEIITNQNEAEQLLETVLFIQPKDTGGKGKSMSEVILDLAKDLAKKVGKPFNLEAVKEKYSTDYNESMNTVLTQEVIKYNVLIKLMNSSLVLLEKALEGKIVMSEDIEKMSKSLFINQVPQMWSNCFLSLKPLSSWIIDYNKRIDFLSNWINNGTPKIFWMPGMYIKIIYNYLI